MTTKDNIGERSSVLTMMVIGVSLWLLVEVFTAISRHDVGGRELEGSKQRLNTVLTVSAPVDKTSQLNASQGQLDASDGQEDDERNRQLIITESKPPADLPELGPNVPTSLVKPEATIHYGFRQGVDSVYEFDIQAELGSDKFTFRGRNTVQATGKRTNISNMEEQVNESSGTGFVIHPEGIVVTCAHVVIGATKIRAVVGDTERTATVIQLDQENDLAVLRLSGGTFPYLQFAHSDKVRLGQEARAIGFPLTDVLGETVKVTRGEVSGRGGPGGDDGIQIDATINPGSSGGPLVDNSGRVIGITSSLLSGVGVSEVGFAVPSNRMIKVAEQLGVPVAVSDEASDLSTPEVIERVSPATVLLKITSGPQGAGINPPHELNFSGYCYQLASATPGLFRSSSNHSEHFNGSMQVDRSGLLVDDNSEVNLPFALGKACLVGIETLPQVAPGRININSLMLIQDWKSDKDNLAATPYGFGSSMLRRRPPWMRLPARPIKKAKAIVGIETTTVALGKRLTDGVGVTKTYSVKFEHDAKKEPQIAITGSGKGKFDPDAGRMMSMDYKMTITVSRDNVTVRVPITMNYKLLSDADLEAERLKRKEREQARLKAKADQSEARGFRSAKTEASKSTDELSYQSVKDAPQTSKLNKFNPDQ